MRLNTDINLTDRLTAGLDLALRRSTDVEPHEWGGVAFRMFHDTPPTTIAKYPDGTYGWSRNGHNPLAYAEAYGREEESYVHGTINGTADYQLSDNFAISGVASAKVGSSELRDWRNEAEFRDYWDRTIIRKSISTNLLDHRKSEDREIYLRAMGRYNQSLAGTASAVASSIRRPTFPAISGTTHTRRSGAPMRSWRTSTGSRRSIRR